MEALVPEREVHSTKIASCNAMSTMATTALTDPKGFGKVLLLERNKCQMRGGAERIKMQAGAMVRMVCSKRRVKSKEERQPWPMAGPKTLSADGGQDDILGFTMMGICLPVLLWCWRGGKEEDRIAGEVGKSNSGVRWKFRGTNRSCRASFGPQMLFPVMIPLTSVLTAWRPFHLTCINSDRHMSSSSYLKC